MAKTISWWKTDFGDLEIEKVIEAIHGRNISQGLVTAEFERMLGDAVGEPYVVCTTSGSMALLMALIAAGVKPGDEVIVPNRTWIATAHAPMLLGAMPILADVNTNRPVIDVGEIERKITPRTKAIIPVHLNGRAAPMAMINQIATAYGLVVIEDAAQAYCSKGPDGFLGCQSFAGCFSLSVPKIISTAQGGFIIARTKEIYERLRMIRSHGVSDLLRVSYSGFGYNFKFTDIQASIGIAQLGRLTQKIANVKAIYARYLAAMPEIPFLKLLPIDIEAGEIPLYSEVLYHKREQLADFLASKGIETRPNFPDINNAAHLDNFGQFPNSEIYGAHGLYLPCGPDQPLENIDQVITSLKEFGKNLR